MQKQSGFTLIELLLVLAIIGIISAIAVPALLGQRERAKATAVKDNTVNCVADLTSVISGLTDPPSERATELGDASYDGQYIALAAKACDVIATRTSYANTKNPYRSGTGVVTYVVTATAPTADDTTVGNTYLDYSGIDDTAGGSINVTGVFKNANGTISTITKPVAIN